MKVFGMTANIQRWIYDPKLYALLVLLLIPVQLGYHFWPTWTSVLGRSVDYLSPTVYAIDCVIIFTILLWIRSERRIMDSLRSSWIALLFFFAGALVNLFFSVRREVSIYQWFKLLEMSVFAFSLVRIRLSRITALTAIGIGMSLVCVLALFQTASGHAVGGIAWILGERTFTIDTPGIAKAVWCTDALRGCQHILRAYGTFPHPNVLGGFIAIFFPPFAASFLVKIRRTIHWIIAVMITGLIVITQIATFSRTAWIVSGVGIVIWLFPWNTTAAKTYIKIFRYIGSIGVIVAFLIIIRIAGIPRESIDIRRELAESAVDIFMSHPVYGTGLGTFIVTLPDYLVSRDVYFLQPVHSTYLLWLVETGVVGAIFCCWLGFFFVKRLKNLATYSANELFCRFWPVAAVLLLGLNDHYLLTLEQGQLMLAVALAIPYLTK